MFWSNLHRLSDVHREQPVYKNQKTSYLQIRADVWQIINSLIPALIAFKMASRRVISGIESISLLLFFLIFLCCYSIVQPLTKEGKKKKNSFVGFCENRKPFCFVLSVLCNLLYHFSILFNTFILDITHCA